ncbi:LOW QUALITY PROTEIN: lung adenoma susceptibility protein 2 [Podargus strigoides]
MTSGVSSPDSTISFLLTSNNSSSPTLFYYKEKLYTSASQALDAYIEDFDLNLKSSSKNTAKIHIHQSAPKQVMLSECHAPKKHALDDFTQHLRLGSPPSTSRRWVEYDLDSISLTTDDLLASPADGSLPFNRRRRQSSEWNKTSLHPQSGFGLQDTPTFKNYPRWFTTQKSDLSISGVSSIYYPAWLKTYNFVSNSSQERGGRDFSQASSSQTLELVKRCSGMQDSSTTDILGGERCWENSPGAFKPSEVVETPLPFPKAEIVHKFLEDCLKVQNQLSPKAGAELKPYDSEIIPLTN